MDKSATADFVNRFYAARIANDVAAVTDLFSDTAHVELAGAADDPTLNKAEQTASGIRAFVDVLVSTWVWHGIDMQSLVIDGESAATRYRLEVTHVPSGTRVSTDIADHFQLRDGLIVSFVEFVDTGLVERLSAEAAR
ncbi:MAG: nuclear transport factor 2 family protein [Pseudomonadota bacterium]